MGTRKIIWELNTVPKILSHGCWLKQLWGVLGLCRLQICYTENWIVPAVKPTLWFARFAAQASGRLLEGTGSQFWSNHFNGNDKSKLNINLIVFDMKYKWGCKSNRIRKFCCKSLWISAFQPRKSLKCRMLQNKSSLNLIQNLPNGSKWSCLPQRRRSKRSLCHYIQLYPFA